jgi:hypothetical protein
MSKTLATRLTSLLLIIFVVISLGTMVLAESYTGWVEFHSEYNGPNRAYSGSTLTLSMTNVVLQYAEQYRTNFKVDLWKKGFLGFDTQISGSLTGWAYDEEDNYPTNYSKTWAIPGNGQYHFYFWKQTPWLGNDEQVYCPYLTMVSN